MAHAGAHGPLEPLSKDLFVAADPFISGSRNGFESGNSVHRAERLRATFDSSKERLLEIVRSVVHSNSMPAQTWQRSAEARDTALPAAALIRFSQLVCRLRTVGP